MLGGIELDKPVDLSIDFPEPVSAEGVV